MSERPARKISGRTIICGRLVLETPAHFGNGDIVGVTDMPLLRDPTDGQSPLLTGASIAGALRNYLREMERGYGKRGKPNDLSEKLFGRLDEVDGASLQSWLLVDDALGKAAGIETRGIANHGFIDSIYFRDPNGYVIELSAKKGESPADHAKARSALDTWQAGKAA